MAILVNTNVASLNVQKSLTSSNLALNRSLQRLSSGLRINSARDDAAGMAISSNMKSNIMSMAQAIRNTNDGISVAQTAESALRETTALLQRMRELSVQSSNGSLSASDRTLIQKEVNQLQNEINSIANNTDFNGVKLLDGTFTSKNFQTGIETGQTVSISISSAKADDLKNYTITTGTTDDHQGAGSLSSASTGTANNVIASQTLTVSGNTGSTTVTVSANASAFTVAASVNSLSGVTGVEATATTTATLETLSADGTLTITLGSGGSTSVITAAVTTTDFTALRDAINETTGTTEVTATSSAGSLTLIQSDGKDIEITNASSDTAGSTIVARGSAMTATESITLSAGQSDSITAGGVVAFNSSESFTVSSSIADTAGSFLQTAASTAVSSTTATVTSIDVSTVGGATSALDIIDAALTKISDIRADLGAFQNRFQANINNLEGAIENVSAAKARIEDADFAKETAELSRAQILQQAGVAMLSQANALPQLALGLLQ